MSASERLVMLQNGFCAPRAVVNLVLDCQHKGINLRVRGGQTLDVEGPHTPELLAALKRWKHHVICVLNYTPSDAHLRNEGAPVPNFGPIQQVSK